MPGDHGANEPFPLSLWCIFIDKSSSWNYSIYQQKLFVCLWNMSSTLWFQICCYLWYFLQKLVSVYSNQKLIKHLFISYKTCRIFMSTCQHFSLNTVKSVYNAICHNMVSHTAQQRQIHHMVHSFNSQMTPHTLPSWASYVVSIWSIL